MKILGVDTSTPIGSVGLIDGENFVGEHSLNIVQTHSSRLIPAIDQILKWANLTVHELDACAVGVGPGSFTGVRIGVGAVKALCYAIKKPIVGVSTLAAVADNLRYTNSLICPILDARRNEIYGAVFHGGERMERKSDDLCVQIEAFFGSRKRSSRLCRRRVEAILRRHPQAIRGKCDFCIRCLQRAARIEYRTARLRTNIKWEYGRLFCIDTQLCQKSSDLIRSAIVLTSSQRLSYPVVA